MKSIQNNRDGRDTEQNKDFPLFNTKTIREPTVILVDEQWNGYFGF